MSPLVRLAQLLGGSTLTFVGGVYLPWPLAPLFVLLMLVLGAVSAADAGKVDARRGKS